MNTKFQSKFLITLSFAFFLFILVGCGNTPQPNQGPEISVQIDPDLATKAPDPTPAPVEASGLEVAAPESAVASGAYPEPGAESVAGYPEPVEEGSAELPNPERNVEVLSQETGSVGGVLVRELDNGGYQSVVPLDLFLAEMILDSNGQAMFVGKTDNSPSANLFETGVFIFQNVVPDTYALIIDLGFSQFPINDENGEIRLIEVVPGEALDLGQVFIQLPE